MATTALKVRRLIMAISLEVEAALLAVARIQCWEDGPFPIY
jgi:hypothetical protein